MSSEPIRLADFSARVQNANGESARLADAGLNLLQGALRIRRGGDGIYGDEPTRPVTKPAEAVAAWIGSMKREMSVGSFQRKAELREALIAAGEEVDAAAQATPSAARLRGALYEDALGALDENSKTKSWFEANSSILPWTVAGVFGGLLLGMYIWRRRR